MIKFENVFKTYNNNAVALDDVSFEVKEKEFISLVGKSGAGKTTLLKLLLAEERPTSGKVYFKDQDVSIISLKHLPEIRRQIGVVFQDYKLLPKKTVFENVSYVLEAIGASEEEIKRDVPQVLDIVELGNKVNCFPVQLSGGEQQRVVIARALVHRPDVILADEPTGNLDPYHSRDIIKLLLSINDLGTTIILSTHNKETINFLGKRVITLRDGRVVRDQEKGKFVI